MQKIIPRWRSPPFFSSMKKTVHVADFSPLGCMNCSPTSFRAQCGFIVWKSNLQIVLISFLSSVSYTRSFNADNILEMALTSFFAKHALYFTCNSHCTALLKTYSVMNHRNCREQALCARQCLELKYLSKLQPFVITNKDILDNFSPLFHFIFTWWSQAGWIIITTFVLFKQELQRNKE